MFTQARVIIGGILIALIVAAVGMYIYRGQKVDKLETTVTEQKVEIGGLKDEIVKDEKSDAITEKTQEKVIDKAKVIIAKDTKITEELKQKEAEIEDSYKGATEPEAVQKKADEKSAARIDALWQTWCEQTRQWSSPDCQFVKDLQVMR